MREAGRFSLWQTALLTLRAHPMLACADLNLPASNYAPIFPNRSTVSPAPSDDGVGCLLVRSRAPKTTAIAIVYVARDQKAAINVDRALTPVSPLKLRSFADRQRARRLCTGLKGEQTGLGQPEGEGRGRGGDWFSPSEG